MDYRRFRGRVGHDVAPREPSQPVQPLRRVVRMERVPVELRESSGQFDPADAAARLPQER